ncbi:MAG TPA: trypsin-like peptidase domain-containing protein [Caulobacteraceae bacterium]|nr:trypsin-like peptidase domain-containing protein [Caulobacteraceae bacterium]
MRSKAFAIALAATSFLAAVPATAPAQSVDRSMLWRVNVFGADGHDPRRIQPRSEGEGQALAGVGVIHNRAPIAMIGDDDHVHYARGQATAFLVSPCLAVSNYHAVYGEGEATDERDFAVNFSVGDRPDDRGFSDTVRAVPAFHGAFDETDEGQDWVVLRLDRCLGTTIGWLSLSDIGAEALKPAQVSTAGYPAEKAPGRLWREDGCHLKHRPGEPALMASDCSATPGASGSPVFVMQDGKPRVVGIVEGAENDVDGVQRRWNPEIANLVVDIGSLLARADVRAAIAADIRRNAAVPAGS